MILTRRHVIIELTIIGLSERVGWPTLDFLFSINFLIKNGGNYMGRQGGLGLVRNLCQTIADRLDYYFVDMNYVKENGNFFLRVYIDKKGGVNLEDCETFSELLSKELDEKDPIKGSYYLEVSSPGLDRPIKTDMDLERNLNREVEISLYRQINNQKNYTGELLDFDQDKVVIMDDDVETEIPRKYIALMRLHIKI